jgi:hypothetical protein
LLEQGVVSGVQVEEKRAALQSIENEMNETPEIKVMVDEIKKIDAGIIPQPEGGGANALILKEMVVQQIDLRLEEITADELVNFYKKTRDDIKVELQKLPAIEAEYNSLHRRMTKLSLYEVDLKKELDDARLKIDSEITAFHVIQEASVPVYPNTTKRILVLLASAIFGFSSGFFLAFMISVMETRLRYGKEVVNQLGLSILMEPLANSDRKADANLTHSNSHWLAANLIDQIGGISKLYEQGKVIMVTSLETGEGRTWAMDALYNSLTLVDIKVATLSFDFRGKSSYHWKGCTRDDASVFSPDQLESSSVTDLIGKLKEDFQLVLIEAPPCEPWVDAETIASYCDASILVLQAGRHRSLSVRFALDKLESPLLRRPLGVILTDQHQEA